MYTQHKNKRRERECQPGKTGIFVFALANN
jgi:hypothetical protein